jgi:hypothetical protein
VIAADADEPADYTHFTPATIVVDHDGDALINLPVGAWAQVWAWFRQRAPRPLLVRDGTGEVLAIDRSAVARVVRRDLDTVVVLEQRDRERVWQEPDA